jgi:hypothetical protein
MELNTYIFEFRSLLRNNVFTRKELIKQYEELQELAELLKKQEKVTPLKTFDFFLNQETKIETKFIGEIKRII